MERKCKSEATFLKWSKVWIAFLLLWTCAAPAIVSAKSAPVGSWDRGTIQKIAAGSFHSLALKSDGTVAAWGDNSYGPTTVPSGLSGVVAIAAGYGHSLALKSDGTVVGWGFNGSGQTSVPSGLTGVVAIAAGSVHSLALKSDGTVVGWGSDFNGQTSVPSGLTGVVAIAAGYDHSLALKSDGTVVAWGNNGYGQTSVPSGLSGVVAIAAGRGHSLALKSDGTIAAWGNNSNGQTSVPSGLTGVIAIAAGDNHSLALKSEGTIVAWGSDGNGQTTVPAGLSGVVAIAAGSAHSIALKSDGTIVAWGSNAAGQTTMPAGLTTPVKGKSITAGNYHSLALKSDGNVAAWGDNSYGQSSVPAGLTGVVAIAAGWIHSLALNSDGTVAAWGGNDYGQTSVPSGLSGVVAIAAGGYHSLALKSDGTVVAWGRNIEGESTVPSGLSGVVAIAAGDYFSLALKSDGTVVAWGWNGSGRTIVPSGLSGVVAIATGSGHSLALKSDGTVAAWGDNIVGQTSVPSGLTGVVAIAAGYWHSLALKSDGTVAAWGWNDNGQTTVPSGLSGVVAIAGGYWHSLALKSDGTVAAWGQANDPGSADLSSLSISAGALSPSFDASVTGYTQYVSASVPGVDVSATLADPTYATLMVNNQVQASGSSTAVNLTGTSTIIPVRVAPFLLPDQTYTITVVQDSTAPNVTFGTNGNAASANTASTTVTVSDTESGVDASTLRYAWTTDTATPTSGWASFTSGDTLTQSGADGDWYLHIQAKDLVGNTVNMVSNPFRLDNTGPSVTITMETADMNAYPDNTWTNQNVTVSAGASDTNSVASITYSLDGGATWSGYTTPIVLQNDSIYSLSFKAVDSAGNETVIQRTVKISTSGLRLTPTLTKADGSAYTSGDWTNGSVTASVYAEAGTSGIAALTYNLDGGSAQAYANQTPVPFAQEGTHTITFQVTDTAVNTLTAPLAVNIDLTPPSVSFGVNGSEAWANSASTSVTVNDSGGSNVVVSTLQYAWTTDTTVPASGWTPFTSGSVLTKNGANGDWYLHIQAQDTAGNTVNTESNRFRLDASLAELSGLTLSSGTLSPVFSANTTSYTATVANSVSSMTVTPATADTTGTVTVSVIGGTPQTVTSGQASGPIALNVGVNTILVTNTALNGTQKTYTVNVTRAPQSSSGNTIEPITTSEPNITLNPDGGITLHVDPTDIVKETLADGTVIENVILSEETIKQVMEMLKDTNTHVITIEINDTERAVQAQLSAASIALIAQSFPDTVIEVKLNGSSFQLQISGLDLDSIALSLGVQLKDLKVSVILKQADEKVKNDIDQIGASQGFKVHGSVIDYKVMVEANGQTLEVSDFGGTYMVRAIVLNGDIVNLNLIAVLYDPLNKTVSFVPSLLASSPDGKLEVVMNVPHNSIYTVIDVQGKTFTDLSGHWAKGDVELLASKLIVSGVTDSRFAPDAAITRAEFAALLVRALGLSMDRSEKNVRFADVAANAWYAPSVESAVKAGLVSGIASDRFAPNERITREQMAVMLSNALTLTGHKGGDAVQESLQLTKFTDQASISIWAKAAVAQSAKAGIISGMGDGSFAPSEYATRAQAAVMLERFLKYVRFID